MLYQSAKTLISKLNNIMKRSDIKKKIAEEIQSGLRGFISNMLAKAKNLPNGSIQINKQQVDRWKKVLEATHYKSPTPEKTWSSAIADRIIHVMTSLKKKETKKPADPRVKEVKETFIKYCENIKGFTPEINHGMEGKMIKTTLTKYTVDEITDLFDWFMNADKYSDFTCSIKTILSVSVINSWLKERG